jgi:hypothetical protein
MARRKRNPGCRDSGGAFIPTPRCRGGVSLTPTKTLKHNGKRYTLVTTGSPGVLMKKAKKLHAQGYDITIGVFAMGVGLYKRGRKTSKTNRTTIKKTDAPKVKAEAAKKKRTKGGKPKGSGRKRKKNPRSSSSGFTYKGHRAKREASGYVVLPYGAGPFTKTTAKKWIDNHVAQTCKSLLKKNPHQAFGVSSGYRTKAESLAKDASKINRPVMRRRK